MIIIAQLRWLKVFLKWLTIILSHVLVRNLFIYLFILFLTVLVFTAVWAFLQLQRAGATLQLRCSGFSVQKLLLLRSTGSRAHKLSSSAPRLQSTGSIVVAQEFSCFAACGTFPDQGSNLCPLLWQVGSSSLSHQGSPNECFLNELTRLRSTMQTLACFCVFF